MFSVSEHTKKKVQIRGMKEYLMMNWNRTLRKIEEQNEKSKDIEDEFWKCRNNPSKIFVTYNIMKTEEDFPDNKTRLEFLTNKVAKEGSGILILGAKRAGKTSFMHTLAYMLHKQGRPCWWYGIPAKVPPFFEGSSVKADKFPENCTIFCDEASIVHAARHRNETSQDFIRNLMTEAHRGRSVVFSTQSSAISDVNILRAVDIMIFKSPSLFQFETERKGFYIDQQLLNYMPTSPEKYLYVDNLNIFEGKTELPKWWTEEYSKPYAHFRDKGEKARFIFSLIKDKVKTKDIITHLRTRGSNAELWEIEWLKVMLQNNPKLYLMNENNLKKMMEKGLSDTSINEKARGASKRIDVEWYIEPLERMRLNTAFEERPVMHTWSKVNINQQLIQEARERLRKRQMNMIITVSGSTGSGKSFSLIALADFLLYYLKGKLNAKYIVHTPEEFTEILPKVKPKSVIIYDEQPGITGAGSGRLAKEIDNAENALRKRQICFLFGSVSTKPHSSHYNCKTFGFYPKDHAKNPQDIRTRLLVYHPAEGTLLGYITLSLKYVPRKFIEKDYAKKKDEYMDRVQKGELRGSKTKMVEKLIKSKEWREASTNSEMTGIANMMFDGKLTTGEVYNLIGMAKAKSKKLNDSGNRWINKEE